MTHILQNKALYKIVLKGLQIIVKIVNESTFAEIFIATD